MPARQLDLFAGAGNHSDQTGPRAVRPDFREREAGKFFVQRVMPARLIDDDEAVAPVASRQHQPRSIERRAEACAVLRAMQAIENRVADRLEVMPRDASSS